MSESHIIVRIPLILNNTDAACDRSESIVREMGISKIDRFDYVILEQNTLPSPQ